MNNNELIDYFIQNITKCNFRAVKKAIKLGVDVNTVFGINKVTVISYAVYHNNLKVIKYLIEKGADPTIEDNLRRDFFKHVYDLYVIGGNYRVMYEKFFKYIYSYEFQKGIIEKHPLSIKSLHKYDMMNPEIKNEYKMLLTSMELNLI